MKDVISVVVPVHNEEGSIRALHDELIAVLGALGPSEILYVDDGSTDGSREALASLRGATVIELSRRYGQATALDAGFKEAKGALVVSMDGDGQNDPADIPRLIAELEDKRLDVVAGWRTKRRDRGTVRFITRAARALRKAFINDRIHDSGCTLRVYRKEAVDTLDLHGEMHRYILALLRWKGFRIGELPVNDRPRLSGQSKYGAGKAVRGLLDLLYIWFLYKYSERPFHLYGYLGLTSLFFSAVSFAFTVYDRFWFHIHVNRDGWFFLAFFFLIMSVMLFSFGIVIDLLARIYHNSSPREKRYYIRSIERHG